MTNEITNQSLLSDAPSKTTRARGRFSEGSCGTWRGGSRGSEHAVSEWNRGGPCQHSADSDAF